jgi:hypothetical protein
MKKKKTVKSSYVTHARRKSQRGKLKGHRHDLAKSIQRFWEGLKVVDADFDLTILLDAVDYKYAVPQDMFNCAFIQAVRRLFNSKHAIFTRTLAYVDLVMDGKERKVYRFELSEQAKRIIRAFDRTKTIAERRALAAKAGTAFVLRAPHAYMRLDAKRLRAKKDRRKVKRRIVLKGTAACVPNDKKRPPFEKKPILRPDSNPNIMTLSDVRSAKGRIQFRIGDIVESKSSTKEEVTKLKEKVA